MTRKFFRFGYLSLSIFLFSALPGCGGRPKENVEIKGKIENSGDSVCDAKGVRTFQVPLTLQKGSPSIPYKAEFRPPANHNFPTVVILPGGPGGTSIGEGAAYLPNLPEEFGLLSTDPRSVGCNERTAETFPDTSLSSTLLANDVALVIQALGLENYFVYGQSYGTVLATILSKRIEDLGLPSPRAFILEGTLGKAFDTESDASIDYVKQWDRVWESIPTRIQQDIKANRFPFELSANDFGRGLWWILLLGHFRGDYYPRYFFQILDSSDSSKISKERSYLMSLIEAYRSMEEPAPERLNKMIMCQEFAPDEHDYMLIDGKLIAKPQRVCGDLSLGKNKFDARNFSIKVPIYYINGERDPATPVYQMQYHYDSQTLGHKTQVVVPDGGHWPSIHYIQTCMTNFWKALPDGNEKVGPIIQKCVPDAKVLTKFGR